jgi:hypothetical protein
MRHVATSFVAPPHFQHYHINGTIFGKKVAEHKVSFDFFYNAHMKHFSF